MSFLVKSIFSLENFVLLGRILARANWQSRRSQLKNIFMLAALLLTLSACQLTQKNPTISASSGTTAVKKALTDIPPLPDPASFEEIGDEELESLVVDIADNQVSANDENPYEALEQLPYGYQVVYSTWRLESEVNSGGFYQYFNDTNAKFSFLAQRAFKEIHAPITGNLLKRAMIEVEEKMPKLLDPDRHPQPFDEKSLQKNNPLLAFDNEFFDGNENLSELRVAYIRSHLDQFRASSSTH